VKIIELAKTVLKEKAELAALRQTIADLQEQENRLCNEIASLDHQFSQEFGRLADLADEKSIDHSVVVEIDQQVYTIRYKELKGLVISANQILKEEE
jgi:hypothetical protein